MLRNRARYLTLSLTIFTLNGLGTAIASSPSEAHSAPSKGAGSDAQCEPEGEFCECEKIMSKLPISLPKGMKLASVAHCTRVKETNYLEGFFYFKGEATVSGEVRRIENAVLASDYVYFMVKNPGEYRQFSSAIDSFAFMDESAGRKVRLPELSHKSSCWAADAVIRVKALKVISNETDAAGSYATDYDVLEVGKYRKCKAD